MGLPFPAPASATTNALQSAAAITNHFFIGLLAPPWSSRALLSSLPSRILVAIVEQRASRKDDHRRTCDEDQIDAGRKSRVLPADRCPEAPVEIAHIGDHGEARLNGFRS